MFGIIKKYKLWYPWQMLRVIYYNFMRINRGLILFRLLKLFLTFIRLLQLR